MRNKILTLLLLYFSVSLSAQVSLPYQRGDQETVKITNEVVDLLVEKSWKSEWMEIENRGRTERKLGGTRSISFEKGNRIGELGYWVIEDDYILNIYYKQEMKLENLLQGSYQIEAITDSTLVLIKHSTSTKDMIYRYAFKSSGKVIDQSLVFSNTIKIDKKTYNRWGEEVAPEQLSEKDYLTKEDLFLRGIKISPEDSGYKYFRLVKGENGKQKAVPVKE